MSENLPAVTKGYEIAVPGTGEIVRSTDEVACSLALEAVREFERAVKEAKFALTMAIKERTTVLGSKSFPLPDGRVASVSAETEVVYDAEEIEMGLRDLGMPEGRIREIVEETTTYKVKAVQAKRAAAANPDYDRLIAENSRLVDKQPYVSIRKR